jgi:hypothetical protein
MWNIFAIESVNRVLRGLHHGFNKITSAALIKKSYVVRTFYIQFDELLLRLSLASPTATRKLSVISELHNYQSQDGKNTPFATSRHISGPEYQEQAPMDHLVGPSVGTHGRSDGSKETLGHRF